MAFSFSIEALSAADAPALGRLYCSAFCHSPQPDATMRSRMYPDIPSTHDFWASTFKEQLSREPQSVFMKAVDASTPARQMVGFLKLRSPNVLHSYKAPLTSDMDVDLIRGFYGALERNREDHTEGKSRIWELDILGVHHDYHGRGVGKKLIEHALAVVDAKGVEICLDASPAARGLYERYGFVDVGRVCMPEPFEWYEEAFMIRKAKAGLQEA